MEPCRQIANYFLGLVEDGVGDSLSNLKLQKLVYYAQGFHLATHDGQPLFDEPVYAWEHGPVVPDLYHSFKQHGSEPIPPDPSYNPESLELGTRLLLEEVYSVYGQFSASKLRNMTHEETPWRDTPRGCVISHALMTEYFKTQLL